MKLLPAAEPRPVAPDLVMAPGEYEKMKYDRLCFRLGRCPCTVIPLSDADRVNAYVESRITEYVAREARKKGPRP